MMKRPNVSCGFVLAMLLSACGSTDAETGSGAGGQGGADAASGGGSAGAAGQSNAGAAGTPGGAGGTPGNAGAAGIAGSDAGVAGSAGAACTSDSQCQTAIATTQPADCAEARCDNGACRYLARDQDGDGKAAKFCKDPSQEVSIETGKDCDDGDPKVYPGAWDGPEGEGHPAACDGVDQDCSGAADDAVLTDKTSCTCKVGATSICGETSSGVPIKYPGPGSEPTGECAYGSKHCVLDVNTGGGKWGTCIGAIPPIQESCDGLDNDCDGLEDEDDAVGEPTWYCDGDGDAHLSATPVAAESCGKPSTGCEGGSWTQTGAHDDCDDTNDAILPGFAETCDGLDNDCDGDVDVNAVDQSPWYADFDNDGHGDANTQPVVGCNAPGLKWKSGLELQDRISDDCDDTSAARHPGAWDGPPAEAAGLSPAGLSVEGFARTAATHADPIPATASAPVKTGLRFIHQDWQERTFVGYCWNSGVADYVALRWTGSLSSSAAGPHTFYIDADDGVRVKVGGTVLIDQWEDGGGELSGTINLEKDVSYDIVVEYYEAQGAAHLMLDWEGPGFSRRMLSMREAQTAPGSCDAVDNDCNGLVDDKVLVRGAKCVPVCIPGCVACTPGGPPPDGVTMQCCDLLGTFLSPCQVVLTGGGTQPPEGSDEWFIDG